MLKAEEKQALLNDYFEVLRVLQWASDNDMLKPDEYDRTPTDLASLFAASSLRGKRLANRTTSAIATDSLTPGRNSRTGVNLPPTVRRTEDSKRATLS